MSFERARTFLLAIRLLFGITGWIAPERAARLFGVAPEDNRAAGLYGRLFATRELFVASTLLALERSQQGRWLVANACIDVADFTAGTLSWLRDEIPGRAAALIGAAALADAVLIGRTSKDLIAVAGSKRIG